MKSSNAVSSAGSGASQFFSAAEIDSICVPDALVDTGSSFSMMSSALYSQRQSKPSVYSFDKATPDIVGVGGASAAVKGYIDVPFRIADVEVAHSLLVVENLSFPLIVGIDVLNPHEANILLGARQLLFGARMCDVCIEPRIPSRHEFIMPPAVACVVESVSIASKTAILVRINLPKSVRNAPTVVLEPLNASVVNTGCAALPAVCGTLDDVSRVAVVN